MHALKDGIHTFLGKEIENGQELSGGQWQTVSSARAMLSEKPLLMMDEPTAALDPMAEVAVYDLIYEKNRQKTVLLVTHRLGAVVHADCIYVLKNGKIEESGSHSELMHLQKDYANLFRIQQHWYQEKAESEAPTEELTVSHEEEIAGGVLNG